MVERSPARRRQTRLGGKTSYFRAKSSISRKL